MKEGRECKLSLWGSANSTIGNVALVGVVMLGQSAAGNITILNATTTAMVINVATTASWDVEFARAIPFTNLVVTTTGAPYYAILYCPRP